MRYTVKFFYDALPEWKKRKDPILSKIFYRPVSFWVASVFSNMGLSANTVSNISTIVGLIASFFFLIPQYWSGIIGALLVNLWLVLDCTDGNIARAVKPQPFGEFVDAVSSYVLVGILFNVMGLHTYMVGGYFFHESIIVIVLGALASSFDSLMRLIYQKYVVISRELGINGKIEADGRNAGKIDKIRIRVDQEIGMGGILPITILIATIFKALDIVIILWCIYYGCIFIATLIYLLCKVNKYCKDMI